MDGLLMLHGATRWCSECAAETIFVPVLDNDDDGHCCTACDAAVCVPIAA